MNPIGSNVTIDSLLAMAECTSQAPSADDFAEWVGSDRPHYRQVVLRKEAKPKKPKPIGTLENIDSLMEDAFAQLGRQQSLERAGKPSLVNAYCENANHAANKKRLAKRHRNALMKPSSDNSDSDSDNDKTQLNIENPFEPLDDAISGAVDAETIDNFDYDAADCEHADNEVVDDDDDPWQESENVENETVPSVSIKSLQFGLMSPEEIRRISVCEITKHTLFDHNVPVEGGLYDTRMGSVLRQFDCTTCEQKFKDCPGHFGRIELPCKVFHPNFLDIVCKVLNTICIDCSALLVGKTKRFVERQARCKRSQDRLRFAHDQVKSKTTNKQCCGTTPTQRYHLPLEKLSTGVVYGRSGCSDVCPVLDNRSSAVQPLEQGCGNYQPKVVRDGIKLVAKYPDLPASVANPKPKKRKSRTKSGTPTVSQIDAVKEPTDADKDNGDDDDDAEAEAEEEGRCKEKDFDRVRNERAGTQRTLTPDEVHRILRRLTDEDCWLLGFDPNYGHPSWMILSVLPVAPPCVRPPVMTPYGKKPIAHDHLTLGLIDIVKEANKLRRQIDNNITTFQDNLKIIVQYHVATYIDNDTKGLPKAVLGQASERERASIAERFNSKTGRLRGNLMGKRVNFSSRTVITPDPNLGINELGVPKHCAMLLTIPERVSRLNIERLQRSVILGPNALSGAKTVIDEYGRMIDLNVRKDIELKYGYIVERHLRNGDLVAFNRQPSLHKFSIMAHRVRLMEGFTFRLNLSVCGPYNADFDGDEMNMHVPQSLGAVAELAILMETGRCIVTPLNNKPIIGLCQDSLLGARLMTMRDVFLTRQQVMQLMMYASVSCTDCRLPLPAILRPQALWTGKQIVSMLLPKTLMIGPSANRFRPESERSDDALTPSDCRVLIRRGELLSGILDKKFVGATNGSIVHVLNNDYGHDKARIFMEEMQGVVQEFVTEYRGMSVGIGDCMVTPQTKQEVQQTVVETKRTVKKLVARYKRGDIEQLPGMSTEQTFEALMSQLLNRARDKAGRKVSDALDVNRNNFKLMSTAGSKGADVNIAQISGIVGQQNQNGGRIPQLFEHRGMPHSRKFDLEDIASRGFVSHSYMDGLTPTEMFMHAVGGREGLTDTAIKSVVGETPIFVSEVGGVVRRVQIGQWIDALIDSAPSESVVRREEAHLELLDISERGVFVPTVDTSGSVTWGRMTAVTRHDPGEVLYRLTTQTGRRVTATASKSVLCYDEANNCLSEIEPQNLVVGESLLPVTSLLPRLADSPSGLFGLEFTAASAAAAACYFICGAASDGTIRLLEQPKYTPSFRNSLDKALRWFKACSESYGSEPAINGGDTYVFDRCKAARWLVYYLERDHTGYLPKQLASDLVDFPEFWIREFVRVLCSARVDQQSVWCDSQDTADCFAALCNRIGWQVSLQEAAATAAATAHGRAAAEDRPPGILAIRHRGGQLMGDVLLDRLVSIEQVDVRRHPKVYDVTVPSTLNFGIANGLMIRDTATIGYIQRRLVKAGEDIAVMQDHTVRNSIGGIVQFCYGGDDMDGACFEWQNVAILAMDNAALWRVYGPPDGTATAAADDRLHSPLLLANEANLMMQLRDTLRRAVYPSTDTHWPLPGNLKRLIGRAQLEHPCNRDGSDCVDAAHVVAQLDEFNERLMRVIDPSGCNDERTANSVFFYAAFVRSTLSPRLAREKHRLTDDALRYVLGTLLRRHNEWQVDAGEGVGLLCAQAIGQPAMQMSLRGSTPILVRRRGNVQSVAIGELVDEYFCRPAQKDDDDDRGSQVLAVDDLECVAVSHRERVEWASVSHVSRHPANGSILTVHTASGRRIEATASHSFLVRKENRVVPIRGSALVVGDFLPTLLQLRCQQSAAKSLIECPLALTESLGLLIGAMVGAKRIETNSNTITIESQSANVDWLKCVASAAEFQAENAGCRLSIRHNAAVDASCLPTVRVDICCGSLAARRWLIDNFGALAVCDRTLPGWLLHAPVEFTSAVLRAYFDSVGDVRCDAEDAANMEIYAHSVSKQLIDMIALCLARFGMPTLIDIDCCGDDQRRIYRLSVPASCAGVFEESIGFSIVGKRQRLARLASAKHKSTRLVPALSQLLASVRASSQDTWLEQQQHLCAQIISHDMLLRVLATCRRVGAPPPLVAELESAANAQVWWDPIVSIECERACTETVYDLTVDQRLQTFMLTNGLFVHNTLNTFHFAGVGNKNVTHGVPRLDELIKASNSMKTPSMTLYLEYDAKRSHEREQTAEQKNALARQARLMAGKMTQITLDDVVTRSNVVYEPTDAVSPDEWHRATVERWNAFCPAETRQARIDQFGPLGDWVLILHLSRKKMFERGIAPSVIGRTIMRHYEGAVEIVHSDDNDYGAHDADTDNGGFVRVRMHAYAMFDALRSVLPEQHREIIGAIEQKIERASLCETVELASSLQSPTPASRESPSTEEFKKPFISEAMAARMKRRANRKKRKQNTDSALDSNDASDKSSSLHATASTEPEKAGSAAAAATAAVVDDSIWGNLDASACLPMIMEHLAGACKKIVLDGVKGVGDVLARETNRTVYHSETGALLKDAQEWTLETNGSNLRGSFALEGIDHCRTRSNNPAQVAKVLGIEAARRCLFEELRSVLQFDGAYVNYRHINLLCDTMTHCGMLMAINRHGLNRRQTGPLMRATLEQSVSMLTNAGCFAEFDPIMGPSERIATGRLFNHGTGTHIELLLDHQKAAKGKLAPLQPLAKKARKNVRGAVQTYETSPFASLQNCNQQFMLDDMREYVQRQRLEERERKLEHERVMRDLRKAQEEDIVAVGNPFARPRAPLSVADVESGDRDEQLRVTNPFSRKSVVKQAAVTASATAAAAAASAATAATAISDNKGSAAAAAAAAAATAAAAAPSATVVDTVHSTRKRKFSTMLPTDLSSEQQIKFTNPFSKKASKPNRDDSLSSRFKVLAKFAPVAEPGSRPFYVPSSPGRRPRAK